MDTQKRTILKSITWRITAVLVTVVVVYIFSGDLTLSLETGLVANLLKAFLYYFHERFWNRSDYGRTPEINQSA